MTALPRPIARILIVALDNLGDLVFTSALTPPLHDAFPDAVIDVWCKAYTASAARLFPHVCEVIAADPPWAVHPQRARTPWRDFLRTAVEVRRRHYDVAIVTEAPWRTAAAVFATGIPVRIGTRRRRNTVFLSHVLAAEDPTKPVVAEQARLLAALDVRSTRLRYALDPARLGRLRTDIARVLPPGFVALHPFAAVPAKRMPLDEWARVAFALHRRSLPLVWCGTAGELDELRAYALPPGHYVDALLPGVDRLLATAAALSVASAFIGHDSGPAHLAGAFGVPVVDVFVGGNPARYGPQGVGRSRIVYGATSGDLDATRILHEFDALDLFSSA